ncbi:PKD domain-containing protein [Flammeovirga sp. EKP202]|uniref:PKD domain-containing protein n=1 Tax=Flammeovirga sp. EKP202 TaxID=2770592 RepID=UPI00165F34AF|nr:PKD domain-containing protein [Flammeovirga sp. EKP202]MBD0400477.1 PKD domain-containing protein [Flammeovirga sp. EKP202]
MNYNFLKPILWLLIITLSIQGHAQTFPFSGHDGSSPTKVVDVKNATYYGHTGDEEIRDMAIGSDGSIYFVGKTSSDDLIASPGAEQTQLNNGDASGLSDAFLVKMDPTGLQRQWGTYYGGSSSDEGNSIVFHNDHIYMVGTKSDQAFITKYDANGRLIWEKSNFGEADKSHAIDVVVANSKIFVIGYYWGKSEGNNAFIASFNSNGNLQDEKTIIGDVAFLSSITTDGQNVYLSGMVFDNTEFPTSGNNIAIDNEAFVAKVNNNNVFQWVEAVGSRVGENTIPIYYDNTDSELVVATEERGNVKVYKINPSNGTLISEVVSSYGGTKDETVESLVVDTKGNIFITGITESNDLISSSDQGIYQQSFGGEKDVYVTKFDNNGSVNWSTYFGSTATDEGLSITLNSNDAIYVGGMASSQQGIATDVAYDKEYNGARDGFFSEFHDLYFITQPKNQKVGFNGTATFTAQAEGSVLNEQLSYQWYFSLDGSTNWTTVSGGNGTTLTITGATNEDRGYYKCVAYSPKLDAVVHSNNARLNVISITASDTEFCLDGTSILATVDFSGEDNITDVTYSWTALPSATAGLPSNTNQSTIEVFPTYAGSYTYTANVNYKDSGDPQQLTVSITLIVLPIPYVDATNMKTAFCSGEETDIELKAIFQYDVNDNDPNNILDPNNWKDDPSRTVHFSWVVDENTDVDGYEDDQIRNTNNSSQNSIRQTLHNLSSTDQKVTYHIAVELEGGCPTDPPVDVIVYALPEVDAGNDLIFCQGDERQLLSGFTPSDGVWTGTGIEKVGNDYYFNPQTSGTGEFTLTLTSTDANNCVNSDQITATVKSLPILTLNAQADEISSGSEASIDFSSTIPEVTFNWVVKNKVNVSGATEGTTTVTNGQYTLKQTLTNTSFVQGEVTYEVTPIADNCEGVPKEITIIVVPTPTVGGIEDVFVCSNELEEVDLTGDVANTIYHWEVIENSGNLGVSDGSSQTKWPIQIENTTNQTQIVKYEITPEVNNSFGAPQEVIVTVYPEVTSIVNNQSTQICSNENANVLISSLLQSTSLTYTWRVTNQSTSFSMAQYTGTINNNDGSSITLLAEKIENLTSQDQTVQFEVTTLANNCEGQKATFAITVLALPEAKIKTTGSPAEICGDAQIRLEAETQNAQTGTTYQWLKDGAEISGATATTLTVTEQGIYTLRVIYNSCEAVSDPFEVIQASSVQAKITPLTRTDFCFDDNIAVTLSSDNTAQNYIWYKDGVEIDRGTAQITVTTEGVYKLETIDEGGCTSQPDEVTITRLAKPTALIAADQLTYCIGDNIQTTFTVNTSNATGTYQWMKKDDSDVFIDLSGMTSSTLTATELGEYAVRFETTEGCVVTSNTLKIENHPEVIIDAGEDKMVCQEDQIQIGTSAIANYSYQWNPITASAPNLSDNTSAMPQVQPTQSNAAGDYIYELTVIDNNTGCSTTDQVTVNISELPVASISVSNKAIWCGNETIDTDLTAEVSNLSNLEGVVYSWENQNGDDLGSDITINVTTTGTYFLTVQTKDNCSVKTSLEITQYEEQLPVLTVDGIATDSKEICEGESVKLKVAPYDANLTYTWLDANENEVGQGEEISINTAGSYKVKVTIGSGCEEVSSDVDIIVKPLPVVSISTSNALGYCIGESIDVTMEASSTEMDSYQWYKNGEVLSGETTASLTTTTSGTYSLIVTKDGCISLQSNELIIQEYDYPTASISADQLAFCKGLEIRATFTATSDNADTYQWQKKDQSDNFIAISGETGSTFIATEIGKYRVVITSPQGCATPSEEKEVREIDLPSVAIEITQGAGVICENDFAELSLPLDPTFTYTWYRDNVEIPNETANILIVTTEGDYHAKVTQNTGNVNVTCEVDTDPVEIIVQPLPVLVIDNPGAICQWDSRQLTVGKSPDDVNFGEIVLEEWSGTDITPDGIFTPSRGDETYTLTFKYQFKYNGAVASCEQTASITITVDPLPVVDLSPLQTSFCNTDIDINLDDFGPFTTFEGIGVWAGKGVSNNIFNPSKAVKENNNQLGIVELQYTFTSTKGCSKTETISVNITDPADVFAGPTQEMCIADETLVVQGASPSGGVWSVETNGATITANGVFSPSAPGTYTVVYTHGSGSCEVVAKKNIEVHDMPQISAGEDIEVCVNDVPFDLRLKTGAIYIEGNNEVWSGEGIIDFDNVLFDPATVDVGTYEISFESTNPVTQCTSTDQVSVRVMPLPVPNFTLATDAAYCVNQEVTFVNTTPDLPGFDLSYRWDFGDGIGSTEKEGTHTFTTVSDAVDVTLIVTTDKGCETSITQQVQIVEAPKADYALTYDPSGCTPLEVTFDNLSEGYALNYRWDFGNGVISTDMNPAPVTYINEGVTDTTYYISLMVNNICGTDIKRDSVVVKALPDVEFVAVKDTLCADELLELFNLSNGSVDQYEWNFGDGSPLVRTADKGRITHAYKNETTNFATYTITLSAFNDCGVVTESKNVVIKPKQLFAGFNVTPTVGCEVNEVVVQSNQKLGENTVIWDFGDGTIVEDSVSYSHIYTTAATYTITLTVSNGCHSDTYSQEVEIRPSPEVDFEIQSTVCQNIGLELINNSPIQAQNTWDFGDGSTYEGYQPPAKIYDQPGVYQVALTINNPVTGCGRTLVKEVEVFEIPSSSFEAPAQVCGEDQTTFVAIEENATAYLWELEDGRVFTSKSVDIVMTNSQNLSLTVINDNDCSTQTTQYIEVVETPILTTTIPDSLNICIAGTEKICAEPIDNVTLYWKKDGERLTKDGKNCVTVKEDGDYVLVAIDDATGCVFTDTMKVNKYQLHLPQDGIFCDTDADNQICPTFDVTLLNQSDFEYEWTNRETKEKVYTECLPTYGMSIGLQSWDLKVTDDKGCELYGNSEFTIVEELFVDVEDQELCDDGEPVYLISQDLSHYDFASYRWWSISDPTTILGYEGTLLTTENGRYVAEVTDIRSGCTVLDTARVTVYPVPDFTIIGYDGPLCHSLDTLIVDNTNIGGLKVEWSSEMSFEGDPSGLSIVVDKAGVYYATVTDTNSPLQCSWTEIVNVEAYPVPQLNLKDTTICSVDIPAELIAEDPEHEPDIKYRWYNIDDPNTVLSTEGIYYADRAGVYAVEAYNENSGCSNFDTARVAIDHTPTFTILGYDSPTCEETVRLYLDKTPSDSVAVVWYKDGVEWQGNVYETVVTESGAYKVTMTNITKPTACASEQLITVWLNEKPQVVVDSIVTCHGDENAMLRASIDVVDLQDRYTYHWYDVYNNQTELYTGMAFPVVESGYYYVEVIDTKSNCLVASDSALATLNALPTFKIGGYDGPICGNSTSLSIEERSLEGVRAEWYLEDELFATNVQQLEVTESGHYKIILTDTTKATNCTYEQSVQVVLNDYPELTINNGIDTLQVCKGDDFTLSYQSDRTVSVIWSTNETTVSVKQMAESSQWYSIVATDKNGCQSEQSIFVNVQSVEFELPASALVCSNAENTTVSVVSGYKSYAWEDETGTIVSQTPELSTNIKGRYTLTVTNALGCTLQKSIDLKDANDETLEALNFPTICDDDISTTIEVTHGFKYYYWEGASNSTGPTFEAYELGTYSLTAVTDGGCEYYLEIEVTDCCGPKIDMDENDKNKTIIFTPHSTPGKNDLFSLKYKYIENFEMRIYSRWGNEVFYTTNPDEAWDGKSLGQQAPSGIYQVIIMYTGCFEGGTIEEKEVIQLYLAD